MSKATVLLLNSNLLADFYFTMTPEKYAKECIQLGEYQEIVTVDLLVEGDDAAEEMFDLTNNPSRREEREEVYGNYRSISVGDIVKVDGTCFLCMSIGFIII